MSLPADDAPAASGVVCPPVTSVHLLDHQPGNDTRYRLTVVLRGGAIRCIAWPDVGWSCGDLGSRVSAEWLASSAARDRKRGCAAFSLVDAVEIAAVVNDLVAGARS